MADRLNVPVPEQLRPLAEQLAALSEEEREVVILAARGTRRQPLRTVPWQELKKLEGTVPLGGDAVEDCNALYNDA